MFSLSFGVNQPEKLLPRFSWWRIDALITQLDVVLPIAKLSKLRKTLEFYKINIRIKLSAVFYINQLVKIISQLLQSYKFVILWNFFILITDATLSKWRSWNHVCLVNHIPLPISLANQIIACFRVNWSRYFSLHLLLSLFCILFLYNIE